MTHPRLIASPRRSPIGRRGKALNVDDLNADLDLYRQALGINNRKAIRKLREQITATTLDPRFREARKLFHKRFVTGSR